MVEAEFPGHCFDHLEQAVSRVALQHGHRVAQDFMPEFPQPHGHVQQTVEAEKPDRSRKTNVAETIDDLTVTYEEDGVVLTKELDKVILSRGAWTTILFRFVQWDVKKEAYGPDRYAIRRYKKSGDTYRVQSKFAISSRDQAKKIIDALAVWIADPETGA